MVIKYVNPWLWRDAPAIRHGIHQIPPVQPWELQDGRDGWF
jgi:hypothetical protein